MVDDLALKIAAVGAAGIGAQWLAWRLRLPAIVLLLASGLVLGPLTGVLDPARDFGSLLRPLVAMAVAIILFEGGLTLNFLEIRHTSAAVRRLLTIGAPLAWVLGSLAAYYVAGLSWQAAIILGGIFVVTGPTVIMPLLRNARLASRPASVLRWEAIVNDPVGALFAVLAFEYLLVVHMGHSGEDLITRISLALLLALPGSYLLGKAIVAVFNRGLAPEYLKAPILLVAVLCAYTISQTVLDETGLLTVTVLGLTIGNSKLMSFDEILRFKETMTVILVSGIFVLLSATIDQSVLEAVSWRTIAFVAVMLLVVRPLTIWTATIGTGLTWQERALIGWIAPRGVVALAVSTHFAASMSEISLSGGREFTAIAFALVASTVVLHGLTITPLARALGLAAKDSDGLLIVGASDWSSALAAKLREEGVPVMIADSNWSHLRKPREAGIETYYGDILSETAEHSVDLNRFSHLLAATDNAAYNRLVCADFAYEFGHNNVYLVASPEADRPGGSHERMAGRPAFLSAPTYAMLDESVDRGARFYASRLTDKFTVGDFLQTQGGQRQLLMVLRAGRRLVLATDKPGPVAGPGDTLISLG